MVDPSGAETGKVSSHFFPNKMGRIVLLALEEVMGVNRLNAVLSLARLQHLIAAYPPNDFGRAFSFDELGRLFQALDEMYGPRGGRGIALRAGHSAFRHGIRDFGPILGVADVAFRLLPLRAKLKTGIEAMAQTFNQFSDQAVRLGENEQYFQWRMNPCGVCWGRKSDSPCCHLSVGILEEGLYWSSGGKTFYVEETTCIAAGEPECTIVVRKAPLD